MFNEVLQIFKCQSIRKLELRFARRLRITAEFHCRPILWIYPILCRGHNFSELKRERFWRVTSPHAHYLLATYAWPKGQREREKLNRGHGFIIKYWLPKGYEDGFVTDKLFYFRRFRLLAESCTGFDNLLIRHATGQCNSKCKGQPTHYVASLKGITVAYSSYCSLWPCEIKVLLNFVNFVLQSLREGREWAAQPCFLVVRVVASRRQPQHGLLSLPAFFFS